MCVGYVLWRKIFSYLHIVRDPAHLQVNLVKFDHSVTYAIFLCVFNLLCTVDTQVSEISSRCDCVITFYYTYASNTISSGIPT
jgi:hypothetical protein